MYELIVTHKGSSYCLLGNSLNIEDYPTIPVGSFVSIPETGDIYYIYGPLRGFDLDKRIFNNTNTSILAEGILGDLVLGE